MNDDDLIALVLLILLIVVGVALTAGNIVTQLLAPFPSVGGPLGAGVALAVFVVIIGKGAKLVLS